MKSACPGSQVGASPGLTASTAGLGPEDVSSADSPLLPKRALRADLPWGQTGRLTPESQGACSACNGLHNWVLLRPANQHISFLAPVLLKIRVD